MIHYSTSILKFDSQGEKTGWTYIVLPGDIVQQLKLGNKKTFRVKGLLDNFPIKQVAVMPMGDGSFILPINATMRKGTKKSKGAILKVQLTEDKDKYQLNETFVTCLGDEPKAFSFFKSLPVSHQNYFSKWIEAAKTETTQAKRITMAVNALAKKMGYPEMLRWEKAKKDF